MGASAEVIVLGAGPAGCAAGTLLARRGVRVLLVDRATFPREKPCAGLLSPRGARAVERCFAGRTLDRVTCARSTAARMLFRGDLVVELANTPEMRFIRRSESDAAFVADAREAGCEVRAGCEAVAVDAASAVVTLRTGEVLRGRILIAADGVHSVARRGVWGRRANDRRDLGFGLVAETPVETLKSDRRDPDSSGRIPRFCFGVMPWGYGWVFPGGDRVSIGVAGRWDRRVDFRAAARAFVEANCVSGTFERLAWRGHPIPFGSFVPRPGRGTVLLVGDAAGLVEPVTGEGIVFALESAELAAESAASALAADDPSRAGTRYVASMRRTILPQFAAARRARSLLYSPLALPLAMHALRRNPERARWYFEVADGTLTYGAYFRRLAGSILDFGF